MSVCVFIIVGGIERFIVRVRVEALVEREKMVGDLLNQFEESEAVIAALRGKLTRARAPRARSHLAINANTAPSGSYRCDLAATVIIRRAGGE